MNDYKAFKKIKNIETRYIMGSTLGQGAFGLVKKCKHIDTKKSFAIKIMKKSNIANEDIYEELLQNELSLLAQNSHPNLIRIIDLIEDENNYYVVSEVVKGGELFQRLLSVKNFTES
jgi:serine/threonine protein kinase